MMSTQTMLVLVGLRARQVERRLLLPLGLPSQPVVARSVLVRLASMARHYTVARSQTAHPRLQATTYDQMYLKSHNNLTPTVARRAPPIVAPPTDVPTAQFSRTTKRMQHHGTAETKTRRSLNRWSSTMTRMSRLTTLRKRRQSLRRSWSLSVMAKAPSTRPTHRR